MEKTAGVKESKALVSYDDERLNANANVGMGGVDPADIRPPQMLLVQKSSAIDTFEDPEGSHPAVGQFFHTGLNQIFDSFECYFLFAKKGKYLDRRKPEEGEKDQYRVLAALADDLSLFGMMFRSSALYALGGLFGFVKMRKRPMFSVKCTVEVKKLSGKQGEWFVPVVRVSAPEKDPERLVLLEEMAKGFESHNDEVPQEAVDDIPF